MKIGVIGSGAIGLYYGAKLQQSGQDVHFLMRRDYDAVKAHGLQVNSTRGNFHLDQVNAHRTAQDIGSVDLVLIGLKTFANDKMIELVRPLVGEQTAILTLQNGLGNEELLAETFGREKIIGGIAFICSNRGEPGVVDHLGEGRVSFGEFSGGLSQRCENLAVLFNEADIPCTAVEDLRRSLWEKLLWNIPFNGLTAHLREDVTTLLAKPDIRDLALQIMREVTAGANAQGLKKPINAEKHCPKLIEQTEKMTGYRPSMMIDRLEGRQLELEAIYKIPLQQAKAKGIEMPRVEMLYQLLSAGEGL